MLGGWKSYGWCTKVLLGGHSRACCQRPLLGESRQPVVVRSYLRYLRYPPLPPLPSAVFFQFFSLIFGSFIEN